jgi:hypothetical protein
MPNFGGSDLEFLGSIRLSSSNVSTGVLTIPPREQLIIQCNIAGYSGGDIASLRFNGDTGANYWDRHLYSAPGGVTWTNAQNLSTNLIRLAATGVTQGRTVVVNVMNLSNVSKSCAMQVCTLTGSAGTGGQADIGFGEWVNTAAQITSVEMRTAGGSITMPAGTGFAVYGKNL